MYIQGLSDFVLHIDKVKILHILAETTLEEMLPTPYMSPFTQSSVEKKMQWHSGSFKNIGNSQQIMLILETKKSPSGSERSQSLNALETMTQKQKGIFDTTSMSCVKILPIWKPKSSPALRSSMVHSFAVWTIFSIRPPENPQIRPSL